MASSGESDAVSDPTEQIDPAEPGDATDAKKPWWKRWWGITLIVVLVLAFLGAVVGEDEDETLGIDEPDDEVEEIIDEDEEPELEPDTDPEPEPEEEPEPEPEPFEAVTFEGSGDDIVDVPAVDDAVLVATFTHDGSSNFAVESFDAAGSRISLMVNEIGNYHGTVPYNFEGIPAELDITADGPWSVTISDLLEQPELTDSMEGSGDQVLALGASGRLAVTHDGDSNFALMAWADRRDVLVNEIGSYQGTVRLPAALALEIVADGNWTLEIE